MTAINDRFKDATWFNAASKLQVVVGGAGGISSWLVLFLARAGVDVIVYDDDIFELHNVGGQFVKTSQVGRLKIEALSENISEFAGREIQSAAKKYDEYSISSKIMMGGFDNMQARRIMFNNWKKHYSTNPNALLIDGRLLFEQIQIFCVTPQNMNTYESTHLFSDDEVEKLACTTTQTSHTAAITAAMMVSFLTNHLSNITKMNNSRVVPFSYEFFVPIVLQNLIIDEKDGFKL